MRRSMRSRRRHRVALTDISLTPLIDTALTLLIIFMVATPMMQNAIRITLPYGQAKEAGAAKQELVVYIDEVGKFFLNDTQIAEDAIIDAIKKEIGQEKEKTVFVRGHKDGSYGKVIELVDHIKVVGGVKYVALATQTQKRA